MDGIKVSYNKVFELMEYVGPYYNYSNWMQIFLTKGGSCPYNDETKGDIKVPLRYTHLEKEWVPKELPPINTIFLC